MSFVTQRVTKDMRTATSPGADAPADRAAELAARGTALAEAAEAAERAGEEPR
jgi:hypothetical protein